MIHGTNCARCGAAMEIEIPDGLTEEFARLALNASACEDCVAKVASPGAAGRGANPFDVGAEWARICPDLYDWADHSDIGTKRYLRTMEDRGCDMIATRAVMDWNPRGDMDRFCLLLVGPSGTGKTRAAYLLLRRMVERGGRPMAFTPAARHVDFAHECAKLFSGDQAAVAEWIRKIKQNPDPVFFDDAGKSVPTPRVEAETYNILEARCAERLPTIYTINAGALDNTRGTDDRVKAIKRRLRDYATVIHFEEQETTKGEAQ